jgi:hypothetical protein
VPSDCSLREIRPSRAVARRTSLLTRAMSALRQCPITGAIAFGNDAQVTHDGAQSVVVAKK